MSAIWKMPSHMENVINTYKTLAKIPNVVAAKLDKSGRRINSKWSIRNIDRGSNTQYNMEFKLDEQFNVIHKTTFGVNISNQLLSADSPQENFKAVIYEDKTGKESKTFLEVWSNDTLAHSIDLNALDIHGNVYGDSEFGCLEWSPDERFLVYVAEKKPKKSEPFIKRKLAKKDNGDDENDAEKKVIPGEEYLYKKDWGEQLTGKIQSVVVVCEVESEKFSVVQGLPDNWCPGQVCFSPSGKSLIGVAWDIEKYRLGLIYCTNRPSYIFCLNIESGALKKLVGDNLSVRSPRVGPLGDLIWLQRTAAGPHHSCHQLMWLPANIVNQLDETDVDVGGDVKTVVDIVETSMEILHGGTFYGIYCQSFPRHCFSADGKRVVFSTPQRNEVKSYVVHLEKREIVDISNNKVEQCSTTVSSLRCDVLLAVCSNLTTPGRLFVGRLPEHGVEQQVQWTKVWGPELGPAQCLKDATVKYLEHQHTDCADTINSFSSIYLGPSSGRDFPLVVWPHGGPHSAFANVYFLEAAFFHMLGFACVFINYRGSVGAGEDSVRFLPSRIGEADVKDCVKATRDVEAQFPVDRERLVLSGGSHGGFLVTSLSGQHPDLYKAVVTRNPVIDVASMMNTSDIPDWCSVEAGMEYREDGPVTEEQLLALRRCSPLVHVHKVKAPTCLLLGSNDKRVPAYQGLEYGKRLKANGVTTRVHMYEDNHTLSSLPVEMDSLINAADWFINVLKPTQ